MSRSARHAHAPNATSATTATRPPLILANAGASLDLIDRVRDAILHGSYSERTSDRPLALDRPVELSVSGIRHATMAMREAALRRPWTAAWVARGLPPIARHPLPRDRYAHVAWTTDLCPYPAWPPLAHERPFDSLTMARAAFAAPMLPRESYQRLVDALWGLASLGVQDPALPDSLVVGCSAGTPWSPPSLVATDMEPGELMTEREKAISMPAHSFPPTSLGIVPVDPEIAPLIPTVLQVAEWHDDKGSRLILSPMTAVVRRSNALDPMATLRLIDDLRRNPVHHDATPTGRPRP